MKKFALLAVLGLAACSASTLSKLGVLEQKAVADGQQRRAEAMAATTRQQLAQSAHIIESGQITLAILIGKGPDRAAEIARPATLQAMALALPDNLPADLLGRRPDIVAARWRVESAQRTAPWALS